jgi:DNA-binding NtrC family response regulator
MQLLEAVRQASPETAVVLLSAFGSVQDAVRAMQNGAADFLGKPFAPDQIVVAVDRALEKSALRRENRALKTALHCRPAVHQVLPVARCC